MPAVSFAPTPISPSTVETHWVAVLHHGTYRRERDAGRFHERDVKLLSVPNSVDLATGLGQRDRVRWPGADTTPATLGSDLAWRSRWRVHISQHVALFDVSDCKPLQ